MRELYFTVMSSPHPQCGPLGMFGQVRSARIHNSMYPIAFSARQAPGFRPDVRDKFGRVRRSGGTPEKRFGFFGFLTPRQYGMVTHNPLVPGSSPGGPTISKGIQQLMALRPSGVPRCEPYGAVRRGEVIRGNRQTRSHRNAPVHTAWLVALPHRTHGYRICRLLLPARCYPRRSKSD